MSDLFAHAGARQARMAANARFEAIWRSAEARTRRRRTKLDLARRLIDEARLCRLLGWRRAAVWWLAEAAKERREAAE